MPECDLLISARWVVPIVPARQVLEHHSVAVSNGKILATGPTAEMTQAYSAREVVSRDNHLLIPGLINAHTHAGMTLFRGLAEDLALEPWLQRRVFPLERQWVSDDLVRDATRLACAEMAMGGVTCFADMYFFPDAAIDAATDAHMRIVAGLPAVDMRTPWAEGLDEHLDLSLKVFDRYRSAANVHFQFTPDSTNALDEQGLARLKTLADQLDLSVHTHLQETPAQAAESLKRHGASPIDRLQGAGLLNERFSAAHAVHLSDEDIESLSTAGAHVVHCPVSNAKLSSGIAPVAKLQAAGVNVGLGSDSALSNNTLDMLGEMRSAALMGRLASQSAAAPDAHTCLEMATIGGARALGLSGDIGSIEVGKLADLCCVDLDVPSCWPVYDPVTQLVFAAQRNQVSDTWVAGDAILANSQLTRLELPPIRQRALEWYKRIQA